jgi:hypothetical protein
VQQEPAPEELGRGVFISEPIGTAVANTQMER